MRSRRHRGVAQDARTAVSPRGPARRAQPNGCIWPAPRLGIPAERRRMGRADEVHRAAPRQDGGAMAGSAALKGAAPVFAALGDETRLRLVSRLCAGGPASIARLTAASSVTRQAITKH